MSELIEVKCKVRDQCMACKDTIEPGELMYTTSAGDTVICANCYISPEEQAEEEEAIANESNTDPTVKESTNTIPASDDGSLVLKADGSQQLSMVNGKLKVREIREINMKITNHGQCNLAKAKLKRYRKAIKRGVADETIKKDAQIIVDSILDFENR